MGLGTLIVLVGAAGLWLLAPHVENHYVLPLCLALVCVPMFALTDIQDGTFAKQWMDEYAGGVGSQFTTSKHLGERGLELLGLLKEDAANLGASDLHELMRCWENVHRMYQAEAHVRTVLYREESRWPGYYFRSDCPKMDDENWLAFCNCVYDKDTGECTMLKKPVKRVTAAA